MYEAVVDYINMGFAVFPLEAGGKKPITKNGCKDATTDASVVKAWWQQYPKANIGIATGSKSGGLVVIDLDIDEEKGLDGFTNFREWCRDHGQPRGTLTASTGRGGMHIYYRSKFPYKNRAGIIEGVDVRGEGGYVVAPPSIHKNGNPYRWKDKTIDVGIQEVDDTIKYFLSTGTRGTTGLPTFAIPERIGEGQRNSMIFKFACMMQAKGVSDQAVYAGTMAENQARCVPPLSEKEVSQAVKSALKYQKGKPIYFDENGKATQGWHEPEFDYTDKGSIMQTVKNMAEAIEYDKKLYNRIKYNVLSYSPFVCGDLPWEHVNKYREWSNEDDPNLICYLESTYGFKSKDKILQALDVVLSRNRFNPVVDMLEQTYSEWDGEVGRIDNLLPNFLGVEKTEYSCQCMRIFMLGAISRAYHAGCKFDYMPVFVGKQGVGKSTFLRLLSMNNAWYNDNFNTVEGDKAPEKLRGMWMVELAELLATKKAKEVESIKAFLTSTVDTYRPPYGRRTEQRPRCCVFAGTTNNEAFLTDRTGNRRFLPIVTRKEFVKKSMFGETIEERNEIMNEFKQAWGEAMHIFKDANENPELILPRELQVEVEEKQKSYMEEDVRVGLIQEYLDRTNNDRVCVIQLYQEALGNEGKTPNRLETRDLHDIMRNDIKGWSANAGKIRCGVYGVQKAYVKDITDDDIPFD